MDPMLSFRSDFQTRGPFALFHLMMLGSSTGKKRNVIERPARALDASDPRDRIFAFLGLSRDSEELGIQPDYTKSHRSVYIETMKAMLGSDLGPNWLALCHQRNRKDTLPSWVVDWSSPLIHTVLSDSRYGAAVRIRPSMICLQVEDNDVLSISGISFDTVKVLGPNMYEKPKDRSWTMKEQWATTSSWLRDVEDTLAEQANIFGTAEEREEVIWRTLVNDNMLENNRIQRIKRSYRQAYQLLHLSPAKVVDDERRTILILMADPYWLGDADPGVILDQDPIMWQEASNYQTQLESENAGRRTFVTSNGYLGLGPENIQPGDKVVLFGGCYTPYIIRETYGELFNLIGGTYVHGIMDGEGILVSEDKSVKGERFIIL